MTRRGGWRLTRSAACGGKQTGDRAKAQKWPDKHRGVALRCSPLNYPTNSDGRNAFVVAASFTDSAAGKNAVVSN